MANKRIVIYRNTNAPNVRIQFVGLDLTGSVVEAVVSPAAAMQTTFSTTEGSVSHDGTDTIVWSFSQAFANTMSPGVSAKLDIYRFTDPVREKIGAFDLMIGGVGDYFDTETYVVQLPGSQGIPGPQGEKGDQGDPGTDGADGLMTSVASGYGIDVDATDPANPVVSAISILAVDVASTIIPAVVFAFRTSGYTNAGDGGAALYKRVGSEPSHAGKLQSDDGAWWELAETTVNPQMLGAAGDGTTDDGVAVLATAAMGRAVQFPPGKTYLIDNSSIIPVSGQRFYGSGALKKTIVQSGYVSDFFTIDAKTNISIDGVKFSMPTGREFGVYIHSSSYITVRNCRFNDSTDVLGCTAVFIAKNSSWINIHDNVVIKGQQGIATGGDKSSSTADGLVRHISIRNNYITECSNEGIDINWDTQRCVISENILYRNNSISGVAGEELDIGGGDCRDITVVGNVIDGGGRSGGGCQIKLSTSDVVISSNVIRNLDTSSTDSRAIRVTISCSNVVIKTNRIYSAAEGISIDSGTTTTNNSALNMIVGNNISNIIRVGVRIAGNTTYGVVVSDNIIRECGQQGILIGGVTNFIIANNYVSDSSGNGIEVQSTASNGSITGNNVKDGGSNGIAIASSPSINVSGNVVSGNSNTGISINGDYITAIGNKSYNNSQVGVGTAYGIVVQAGSDYLILSNNHAFDNQGTKTQKGIWIQGACDRCVVTGNISYNNESSNITGSGSLTNSIFDNNITA